MFKYHLSHNLVNIYINVIWILLFSLLLNESSSSTKPNILLILVDDLGWNDIGFHGKLDFSTPNIDKLATDHGLILNNYYVQSLCTPSRAALLTGIYPFKTGIQHAVLQPNSRYGLPLEYTLLSQDLKNNGYTTHLFGKWHLGYFNEKYTPNYRGFDNFYGYYNGMQSFYNHTMSFTYNGIEYKKKDLFNNNQPINDNIQYSTHIYKTKTIETIYASAFGDQNNPFFIYLALQNVHEPLEAPQENIDAMWNFAMPPIRKLKAAKVKTVDDAIGDILEVLNSTNIWDNTLLIFSTDNGAPYGDGGSNYPLRALKVHCMSFAPYPSTSYIYFFFNMIYIILSWEGGVRGTAFISGGWLNVSRRGQVTDEPMHITDIYPTIMDIVNITASNSSIMDGKSFFNVIQDSNATSMRDETVLNIDPVNCDNTMGICGGIRIGDWKLVIGNQVARLSTPDITNDFGISGWVSNMDQTYYQLASDTITGQASVQCDVNTATQNWNATNVGDKCPFNGKPCLFNIKV